MCTPECSYTWQVSGQEAQGDTLTVTVSGQHQSLELVCTAVNPTNNDSQSTDKTVQVDSEYGRTTPGPLGSNAVLNSI